MADLGKLKALTTPPAPSGWTPGVQWDGETGSVTTYPREDAEAPRNEQWDSVLERFGLDPESYMVDGPVRHSAWDVPGHGIQHAHKARIVERPERRFDIEDLLDAVYADPDYPDNPRSGWRTIMLSDTHIGKSLEDGGGTDIIISRWKNSVDRALEDGPFEGINLVFGGDLIEGYVSQHGKNIGGCDLTLTEQIRVASHMVSDTIQQCLGAAEEVVVAAVPGNHGESTRVANVSMTDSHDLQIVNNVQQALELARLDDRVSFYYPEPNTGDVTYTAGDLTYTVVHGHRFSGGPVNGAEKWWSGQITNDRPPASSDVLLFGHFHGMRAWSYTARRWIMCAPALETESRWFANSTGATGNPGVLIFDDVDGKPANISIV
ncbi:hypothetical protein [Corynebacterium glyciniphilum]|uniref:hypothetical protein n=2 Tax=Corynebacterium glyciniphilum TaxID=1404244 RepID=UPI00265226F6|nr:hypothetical protein [Corynebacterium glyciniphilum]MDN6706916.1 hypothetical protein [Corynebacterium glyciniphilum]